MSSFNTIIFPFAAGAMLGVLFFGGLWWTVQRGMQSPRPAIWFVGSVVVRITMVLFGFYLVGANEFSRLLACLVGFTLARFVVMRFTKLPLEIKKEDRNAP